VGAQAGLARQEAVELDPDYADAWVGLADALALMEDYGYGDREELLARAEVAVRRALELAPDSAGARTSLGLLRSTYQDGPATIREFEHAIRVQPSYADAHNWHAWVSLILGRGEVALASARRAVELNPLSAEPVSNLALANLAVGRPQEALVEARRSQELSPFTTGVFYEGIALYDLGRYEEAREVLEPLSTRLAGDLSVPWAKHGPDATLALVLVALGEPETGHAVLDTIDRGDHPFAAGLIHLAGGRTDDATDAFARVREMSAWPCMALHHHYRDVWRTIAGTEAHRRLVATARRRWQLE
jgi:tetratricopeptide (TPR) repeat protein